VSAVSAVSAKAAALMLASAVPRFAKSLQEEEEEEEEEIDLDKYRYNMPWSLNLAYSLTYNNSRGQ